MDNSKRRGLKSRKDSGPKIGIPDPVGHGIAIPWTTRSDETIFIFVGRVRAEMKRRPVASFPTRIAIPGTLRSDERPKSADGTARRLNFEATRDVGSRSDAEMKRRGVASFPHEPGLVSKMCSIA